MQYADDNAALTAYVFNHYGALLTRNELLALRNTQAEAKATAYGSPSAEHIRQHEISHDPEVRRLLAEGTAAFRARVRDRILSEHGHEIYLNRCPKCGALARTPTACLCPSCNHTWYELRKERNS